MESASYFDRTNHREVILLEEVRPLPGAVSRTEVFGLPCPRHLHFAEMPQNKNPRPAKASSWLYLERKPASQDVGLRASLPNVESLPLKDDFRVRGSNRPPSPPPSPGHPDLPRPTPFPSFDDSPSIRGLDDSARPISPMDSLLESPQPVNWDIGDDEPMGRQIPDVPLEDIEMSAVDLGDESPKLTALTPPRVESSPIIPIRSPTPVAAPHPPRRARREPLLPQDNPKPSHRSPSRRNDRKHGRQRSRTPSPPRRRGDSYRPSAPYHNRRDDRRPYNQANPPQPASSFSGNPWSEFPSSSPWPSATIPNAWSPPNTHQPGGLSVPWGPSPGYMPWGFNQSASTPWSIHYPGYYPMDNFPMPGWPPLGYPPIAPPPVHNCPSCHNCHSCGRPSSPSRQEDPPHASSTTPAPSLLGRLQTPSLPLPLRNPTIPLAQRLRDPTPLIDRMVPARSLAQRLQSPAPDFVQGSSSRPLAGRTPNSFTHRLREEQEEGEFSEEEEDESSSRARRSRRGGRKERERDQRRAERGAPPAPGKGKRRDRRDRDDDDGFLV